LRAFVSFPFPRRLYCSFPLFVGRRRTRKGSNFEASPSLSEGGFPSYFGSMNKTALSSPPPSTPGVRCGNSRPPFPFVPLGGQERVLRLFFFSRRFPGHLLSNEEPFSSIALTSLLGALQCRGKCPLPLLSHQFYRHRLRRHSKDSFFFFDMYDASLGVSPPFPHFCHLIVQQLPGTRQRLRHCLSSAGVFLSFFA